jgi:hypothetical protein
MSRLGVTFGCTFVILNCISRHTWRHVQILLKWMTSRRLRGSIGMGYGTTPASTKHYLDTLDVRDGVRAPTNLENRHQELLIYRSEGDCETDMSPSCLHYCLLTRVKYKSHCWS